MLEAIAHNQLKLLLRGSEAAWPNSLTLCRLVARSLRRQDTSLIEIESANQDSWWLGLMFPLAQESSNAVLFLPANKHSRFLNVVLPKLKEFGIIFPIWDSHQPPPDNQLWLVDEYGLIIAFESGNLNSKQLIIPEAELISENLREAMSIKIIPEDWENLIRTHPNAESSLLKIHENLSRKFFSKSTRLDDQIAINISELLPLKDLITFLKNHPKPWNKLANLETLEWASWATLNYKTLTWNLNLKPIDPLLQVKSLFKQVPTIFITSSNDHTYFLSELRNIELPINVRVNLSGPIIQEPIPLFIPNRQPLPNSFKFHKHVLDQCSRLILGRSGLTIILLEDEHFRRTLTAELASEFGKRVLHQETCPQSNGVICADWSWWLQQQDQLPCPEQVIVVLLPLTSLTSPLMAARVSSYKRAGRDWFRDLLLPESLNVLSRAVLPLRKCPTGRLAILDGRLRSRAWGKDILRMLEPWTPLHHLLPD